MKQNSIILYTFLSIIVLLLGYLVFKNPVSSYLEKRDIAGKVNLYRVPEVYVACYDYVWSESDSEIPQKCKDSVDKYMPIRDRWDSMIKEKSDIDCKDFTNNWEAMQFNSYIGNEFVQYINPNTRGKGLLISGNPKCTYDPYGLDTDGDCQPCE